MRAAAVEAEPMTHNPGTEKMLDRTRELFRAYLQHVVDGGNVVINLNAPRRELAIEIAERLDQLAFVVARIRRLDDEIAALQHHPLEGELNHESSAERAARLELRVLTESFYYCASRVRAIARNSKHPLPGLGGFECRGVRDVRNHLLEHPEGSASLVLTVSFGRGGAGGPVIKPLRPVGRESVFPDPGLFINADEFITTLNQLLLQALKTKGV